METWMLVRTFIAFFLALFGVGLVAGTNESGALLGAVLAALGLTFLLRFWVAIKTGV
jgi:uncharacterized membrane protein YqaE (UPF0057 family)